MSGKTERSNKPSNRITAYILTGMILAIITLSCNLPITLREIAFDDEDTQIHEVTLIPDVPELFFEKLWKEEWTRMVDMQFQCSSLIEDYKSCLEKELQGGSSAQSALESCSLYKKGLELNDKPAADGQVVIRDENYFYRDKDNVFHLVYQSNKVSSVSGFVEVEYFDGPPYPCAHKISYHFTGFFNPETCTMKGLGTYKSIDEDKCLGGENLSFEAKWEATLMDGYLRGFVDNTAISFNYWVR